MKKMWKKNTKAVSPVIATILMVAITVVLAAVLYVMVMGFGGNTPTNPTASLSAAPTATAHQEKIAVASISENLNYTNYKVSIVIGGTSHLISTLGGGSMTLDPTAAGYTVTMVDLAADGKLSTGDYFLVTSTASGDACSLNLLFGADSTSIAADSWTQP